MAALFSLTLFTSAGLLFLVQPMLARMVLPALGGSPAVWTTCMLFYQVVLLAGYAYARGVTAHLAPRYQVLLHLAVVALPIATLPIAFSGASAPAGDANPMPWLLLKLLTTVGPVFFVVSSSAPMLQRWFANARGTDPYFLYAVGNAGSLLALLAYPFLIEPMLTLGVQSRAWSYGFFALALLTAACGAVSWRGPAPTVSRDEPGPDRSTRLRWILLSAVPSSLLLGVTMHFSTDIAAVPLLWVVPLAMYLLTFVIVFAPRQVLPDRLATILQSILVPILVAVWFLPVPSLMGWFVVLHLATFFVSCLACHGELARTRPSPRHLGDFYLCLAVGGALGGLFNAIAAPMLFSSIVEYPLALALACALRPKPATETPPWLRMIRSLGVIVPGAALLAVFAALGPSDAARLLMLMAAAVAACGLIRWGRGFAMVLCGLLIAGAVIPLGGDTIRRDRSFFGVHRVERKWDFNVLIDGNTVHGAQSVLPEKAREALTYYHVDTLVGRFMVDLGTRRPTASVAVLGLGSGSLAAYAVPSQRWTYFEIDPAVERIARDPRCFTFLRDCRAPLVVVLGDARLMLQRVPDGSLDVIIADVFSSDAIPVHLLTREAMQVYLSKLAPGGALAFNISNLYLDCSPVVAALVRDAGLVAIAQRAGVPGRNSVLYEPPWILMARRVEDLGSTGADPTWKKLEERPGFRMWTDDYSNLLQVLRR